jgi:hypothetical protein
VETVLMTCSLPLDDLFISLGYILRETNRPESQAFTEKLLSQLREYQTSEDPDNLADINHTFEEWKESSYLDEWSEKDIDSRTARSMTYIL